jgi:hypothetical protein
MAEGPRLSAQARHLVAEGPGLGEEDDRIRAADFGGGSLIQQAARVQEGHGDGPREMIGIWHQPRQAGVLIRVPGLLPHLLRPCSELLKIVQHGHRLGHPSSPLKTLLPRAQGSRSARHRLSCPVIHVQGQMSSKRYE